MSAGGAAPRVRTFDKMVWNEDTVTYGVAVSYTQKKGTAHLTWTDPGSSGTIIVWSEYDLDFGITYVDKSVHKTQEDMALVKWDHPVLLYFDGEGGVGTLTKDECVEGTGLIRVTKKDVCSCLDELRKDLRERAWKQRHNEIKEA